MTTREEIFKAYDYFKQNGDNDKTWSRILPIFNDYINCILESSTLYRKLYADIMTDMQMSVVTAFRTFNDERNANIFTWTTRLLKQCVWRGIRDELKNEERQNILTEDYSEFSSFISTSTVEDDYINNENKMNNINTLNNILNVILRNDIYREIYYCSKGINGYSKRNSNKDIAEELQLTEKTVNQAVKDNRRNITFLKKYIAEGNNLDDLTVERFFEFKKCNK